MRAKVCAPSASARKPSAVLAATPASFQPSNATSRNGRRRVGCWMSVVCSMPLRCHGSDPDGSGRRSACKDSLTVDGRDLPRPAQPDDFATRTTKLAFYLYRSIINDEAPRAVLAPPDSAGASSRRLGVRSPVGSTYLPLDPCGRSSLPHTPHTPQERLCRGWGGWVG